MLPLRRVLSTRTSTTFGGGILVIRPWVDAFGGLHCATNLAPMNHPAMIGFGIFGCGRIGRMHARNIAGNPRASLVACYDVAPNAASAMSAELGCRAAESVEAILGDPAIDAVFIASSTETHVDLITSGVKAKKAVLCEKPVDLDIARVDA